MTAPPLAEVRSRFARDILARAAVDDPLLLRAFSRTPRERFLGPGPWRVAGPDGYRLTESDDPRDVYVDALVALDASRRINNGEPSAHALWIHVLALAPGDRVDHIGAGTGYYTSILAELVGGRGRVEAFEIDPALAHRAREALAERANVVVHAESGLGRALPVADAIYVNAGATGPDSAWLDALAPGGRLVFPLTGEDGFGGMLKIVRADGDRWPASFVSGAAFVDLIGGREHPTESAVSAAFRRGGTRDVRWLARDGASRDADWLRGEGWRLTG